MLHSISYFITGLILFSITVFPTGVLQADELSSRNHGIHGTVVDEETNNPIANASISLAGEEFVTETGEDGTFHISDLEQGEYTLLVTAEGYNEKEVEVSLQSPDEGEEVLIELQPAY